MLRAKLKSCRSWAEFWEIQISICEEMCKKLLVLTKSCQSQTDGPALVSNTGNRYVACALPGHNQGPVLLHRSHAFTISANSRFAPSQWETTLHCKEVSHWLGASLESALTILSAHGSAAFIRKLHTHWLSLAQCYITVVIESPGARLNNS